MQRDAEFSSGHAEHGALLTSGRGAVWIPGSGALEREVACLADLGAGGSWESWKRKNGKLHSLTCSSPFELLLPEALGRKCAACNS